MDETAIRITFVLIITHSKEYSYLTVCNVGKNKLVPSYMSLVVSSRGALYRKTELVTWSDLFERC